MPGATTKYVVPYSVLGDTVASVAQSMQDLAGRVDLLLGESGSWAPAMTANVEASTSIVLSRTYPGNIGAAVPGIVIVQYTLAMGTGVIVAHRIVNWTGTATTITGFDLKAISSTTNTRTFQWRFLPVL